MSVGIYHWTWEQGEDLQMSMVYKLGPLGGETPVDLTGYSVRMDVVSGTTRVFTFNSADIPDATVDNVGTADNEATLGADGTINIIVSRLLTLEGGAVYSYINNKDVVFNYDMFLRGPDNRQRKFMTGTIVVHPSYTLWK